MKIDDSLKKTAGLGVNNATPSRAGKAADQSGISKVSPPTDNVTLSNQVELAGQASSTGVFDTKKVDEIKAAIANGQFQVNAENVADGLMDTVKDLISARKG